VLDVGPGPPEGEGARFQILGPPPIFRTAEARLEILRACKGVGANEKMQN